MYDVPAFFLHAPVDFGPVVRCLEPLAGLRLDWVLPPRFAEHVSDLFIYIALQRQPGRTQKAHAATVHVLHATPFASWIVEQIKYRSPVIQMMNYTTLDPVCSALAIKNTHMQRMDALASALPALLASIPPGLRLLVPFSYWNKDLLGSKLNRVIDLNTSRFLFASSDPDYPYAELGEKKDRQLIVVPYVATAALELLGGQMCSGGAAVSRLSARPVDYMFHGNPRRHHTGILRGKFLSQFEKYLHGRRRRRRRRSTGSVDFVRSDFTDLIRAYGSYGLVVNRTSHAMLQSRFCIVMQGDTMTSRRLFDALAAGCVPIHVGGGCEHLPFADVVDYSQLMLDVGDLRCSIPHLQEVLVWLHRTMNDTAIRAMACAGVRAFHMALSFRNGAAVKQLLRTAAQMAGIHAYM